LRIDAVFEASLAGRASSPSHASSLRFSDENQPDRIGWREIVASTSPTSGARLGDGAPTQDRTDGLRRYPTDPGVAPLDVRAVSFTFTPGHGTDGAATIGRAAAGASVRRGSTSDRFVRLLDSTTSSPLAIAGALVVALLFGAVHAFGPGHGKTVMAAYLVSTEGRKRDAFALGIVVSLMHTVSVLVLAAVLATVGKDLDAGRLYPALTVVAGVLVVAVGARLLAGRLRSRRDRNDLAPVPAEPLVSATTGHVDAARYGGIALLDRLGGDGHHHHDTALGQPHADDDHEHGRDHGENSHHHGHHEHGPGTHTHDLPADVSPLSRAGLIALGTSGGLFPSPSAVIVLLGAFGLGRATLGLALIVAFSVGLAAVLVTIGLLLVAGRKRITESRFAVHLPWLPVAGAAAIVVLGVVLVGQGVAQLQ
jgi:ABC-type nickel/cobalt efflux system permease component RcnA